MSSFVSAIVNNVNNTVYNFLQVIAESYDIDYEELVGIWDKQQITKKDKTVPEKVTKSNTTPSSKKGETIPTKKTTKVVGLVKSNVPKKSAKESTRLTVAVSKEKNKFKESSAPTKRLTLSKGKSVPQTTEKKIQSICTYKTKTGKQCDKKTVGGALKCVTHAKLEASIPKKKSEDVPEPKEKKVPTSVIIRKNQYGNYEDPESHIIFSKKDKAAIGKQVGRNVIALKKEDIALCEKYGWAIKDDATEELEEDEDENDASEELEDSDLEEEEIEEDEGEIEDEEIEEDDDEEDESE